MGKNNVNGKPIWRRIVEWLHLWLGFGSGLILFVVCLTGVLFVFHDEVNDLVNRDKSYVVVPEKPLRVSPDSILANFAMQYPKTNASLYTEFADPRKASKIMCFTKGHKTHSMLGMGTAYANPYTGEILGLDNTYGIFRLLAGIHTSLLLGKTGTYLVEISTVIFLIELITGLIWWWPKKWTKSTRKKSFSIKWSASWKRINIDLHNVLGFYALPLALVLTVTGLVLSYKPVKDVVFSAFGAKNTEVKPIFQQLPHADSLRTALPLNVLLKDYRPQLEDYEQLTFGIPNPRSGAVMVRLEKESSMVTYRGNRNYVNVYTGEPLNNLSPEAIKLAEMSNMNIKLHIGTWYGLSAKIITFIVCLICTALPVTGYIIWYNRKFKKTNSKTKAQKQSVQEGSSESLLVKQTFKPRAVRASNSKNN